MPLEKNVFVTVPLIQIQTSSPKRSHATMSVKKLLGRVVAPELTQEQMNKLADKNGEQDVACHIHEFTYGINAEPLALLALTFSSIIHDVDHRGVSNTQLAVEEPELAKVYRQTSIAEQHSVTMAWDAFMEDRFDHLRQVIFASEPELLFFRELVVNVVLATDIFDKDLNALRKSRWEEAFASVDLFDPDLRATIVLEHIMQASDVSHTMQHWCVYQVRLIAVSFGVHRGRPISNQTSFHLSIEMEPMLIPRNACCLQSW